MLSSTNIVFGIITQTDDRPFGSPVCIAFWLNFNCSLCLNNLREIQIDR